MANPTIDTWSERIDYIKSELEKGISLEAIGAEFNVSRQRVHQVLNKYGLRTNQNKRSSLYFKVSERKRWLIRNLRNKGFKITESLLHKIETPKFCPIFNIKLNYDSFGYRQDDSPSIDRINPKKGYELDNIHIISMRANRIKNNSTLKELKQLVKYFTELSCKD